MEKSEKPASAKKIERIAYISFGVIFIFVTVIVIIIELQNRKFLKDGIRVEATVDGLYESGTTKNKTHTMMISMFTKGAKREIIKTDTTGKTESEKKVNAILDNITINPNIGSYLRLTIDCSSESYEKYRPGDKITVLYLKEDSTDVRILSELE